MPDYFFTYKGEQLRRFAFPVGGIGTGSISFNGYGGLSDWEIYGRPNKATVNGMTCAVVKAKQQNGKVTARMLHADFPEHLEGHYLNGWSNQGFGAQRELMTGFPHFKSLTVSAAYPVMNACFDGGDFPGRVSYEVFNPLIPGDEDNSSIPAAFIEYTFTNTTSKSCDYSLAFNIGNPHEKSINTYQGEKFPSIILGSSATEGQLCLMTGESDVSHQCYWYRGGWFDNVTVFWDDFTNKDRLQPRYYDAPGNRDMATLACHFTLGAGESRKLRYVLAWRYPTQENYWNPLREEEIATNSSCECSDGQCCPPTSGKPTSNKWINHYATVYPTARDAALYAMDNWDSLYARTMKFTSAMYHSDLPEAALESISGNLAILKSTTCLRLEDGSFYAFEGCSCSGGCCEGSCQHVWNYQYALAFLFPNLERSMRQIELDYCMREDGGTTFRVQLPLGRSQWGFRPCCDGHFGTIIKIYREWKISGDSDWLRRNYHKVKKMISYTWAETNQDRWDYDKKGYLSGIQHHTLDMELFGANSWLSGMYLLALWCCGEMAEFMGDADKNEYREIYARGRQWINDNTFNGKYYHQLIDYTKKSILEEAITAGGFGPDEQKRLMDYWDSEHNEIKYQIAEGCGIDQVLAGYHAKLIGADYVFDKYKQKKALHSIYKYNFQSMRDVVNFMRIYAANDEKGLLICTFPEDARHAIITVPYTTECMNGFEYQAAVHMIYEDMEKEGMNVVEAVRQRYDGRVRNPFNEFECGSHYARSMASYSLLSAYSNFEYDMTQGMLGFDPKNSILGNKTKRCFFAVGNSFGYVTIDQKCMTITIEGAPLKLAKLRHPSIKDDATLKLDGGMVPCKAAKGEISFDTIEVKNEAMIFFTQK